MSEDVRFCLERAKELFPEMKENYIDFHQHPELGGEEFETAKKVEAYLKSLDIEIVGTNIGVEYDRQGKKSPGGGTGIVAIIRGSGEGKSVLLRADMDALPIQENPNNPYPSKNPGVSHACGHDAHTAGLMGAAKILKERADAGRLKGDVILLFQPSEEKAYQKESGAIQMVRFLEEKRLRENAGAVFGLHVYTDLERGEINLKEGMQWGSSGELDIVLKADGGHVMNAYEIPNIKEVDAAITVELGKLFKERSKVEEGGALIASTGTDFSVGGYNIVRSESTATWVVRITSPEYKKMSNEIYEEINAVVKQEVEKHLKDRKGTIDVEINRRHGYRPGVHRDANLVKLAEQTIKQTVANATIKGEIFKGGEDFAFYLEKFRDKQIDGIFMMIGAANTEKRIKKGPHHTPNFQIDTEVLTELAATHSSFVMNYFDNQLTS